VSQTKTGESYSPEETARRRDKIVRQMLATPPKPHSEMKIGKRKASRALSPRQKRRKSQAKKSA
jgi:hypothetical protein